MNIYLHEVYTRTSAFNSSGEIYVLDNLEDTIKKMYLDETVDLSFITDTSLSHEAGSSISIPYTTADDITGYERFYELTGGVIVGVYTFKDYSSNLLKGAHFIKDGSQILLSPDNKNYPMGLKINKTFPGKNGYSLYNGAFVSYTPNQKHSITLNFDFLPEETYRKILELVDKKVLISAEPKENITLVDPSETPEVELEEMDFSWIYFLSAEELLTNDGTEHFLLLGQKTSDSPTTQINFLDPVDNTSRQSNKVLRNGSFIIQDSMAAAVSWQNQGFYSAINEIYPNIISSTLTVNGNSLTLGAGNHYEIKYFNGYGTGIDIELHFDDIYETYPDLPFGIIMYNTYTSDFQDPVSLYGLKLDLTITYSSGEDQKTIGFTFGTESTYYQVNNDSTEEESETEESTLPVVSPFEGKSFVCYLQDDSIDFDYTISVKQAGYKGSLTFLEA